MTVKEPFGIYEWYNHKRNIFVNDISSMTLDIIECDLDATEILNYVHKIEKRDLYPFLSAFLIFDNTINEMMNKELKSKARFFCEPPKGIQEITDYYDRKKALYFQITEEIKKRIGKI